MPCLLGCVIWVDLAEFRQRLLTWSRWKTIEQEDHASRSRFLRSQKPFFVQSEVIATRSKDCF